MMKTDKGNKRRLIRLYQPLNCWAAVFFVLSSLSGCSWLTHPPVEDPQARQMVEQLQQANASLERFKELANIQIGFQQEVQTVSMALAADLPNRMRVELLSVVGQPMTSLVADGRTIRIRPHGKERIYQLSQTSTALEPLINLPIGIEELQGGLIGRPKLPEYRYALLQEPNGENLVVALKSRWMTLARLEFNASDSKVRMLEVYDEEGNSLYRIHWIQWRHIGSYSLPSRLQVESDAGYTLTIKMKRFWPDVALSDATFELDTPGSEPSGRK